MRDGKQRSFFPSPRMLRLKRFILRVIASFYYTTRVSEPFTTTESTSRTRSLRDCRVARGNGNVTLLSTLHCFLRAFISPLLSPSQGMIAARPFKALGPG